MPFFWISQLTFAERLDAFVIKPFDTDGADKSVIEVRSVKIVDSHGSVFRRCMNKFTVADVYADVADRSLRAEEHQISFQQFIFGDASTNIGLFIGGAGQAYVKKLIYFTDKCGTVNPPHC